MKRVCLRSSLILAAIVAAMVIAGAWQVSYAAMGDRSPAGSVPIAANGVVTVPENTEVKLNFGMNYPDYNTYYYFKITPSKTGYITFTNDYTHTNAALCNLKKKIVSAESLDYGDFFSWDSSFPYQRKVSYGVKKGTTYLVRIKQGSTYRSEYGQPYIGTVKWTNTKVKQHKYGKSKKKAVKIKKKKTIKGVFVAGNRKAHWYKFKGAKKGSKVYISSKNHNGTIYAQVSGGGMYPIRLGSTRHDISYKDSGKFIRASRKTTFYIKVYPDKKSSGSYTIRWK